MTKRKFEEKSKKASTSTGKSKKQEREETAAADEESASSPSEAEESESESSEGEAGNDGLADMMSKILNQNTGAKIPVLAKRKTALMKDIEEVHKDTADLKKLRSERRVERSKQMVTPDVSTADYERQLKKLATRGVVALFNAIAKAKRETVAAEDAKAKKETTPAAEDNGSIISRNSVAARGKATAVEGRGKGEKAAETVDAAGASGAKWAALRDDYMVGQKLTVKHWDKAVESDSD